MNTVLRLVPREKEDFSLMKNSGERGMNTAADKK